MNDSPCHKCDQEHPGRRYFGCFADCDDYKVWKNAISEQNKKASAERIRDAQLTHYAVDMARKQKRRKG